MKVRGFGVIFGKAETDTLSSGIISTKFVMNWGYAITPKNKHRHWTCREQCKFGSFVIMTDYVHSKMTNKFILNIYSCRYSCFHAKVCTN